MLQPPRERTDTETDLILEAIARGYTIIPLAKGTKRPLVAWGALRFSRPSPSQMLRWFAQFGSADVGLVTGQSSGVICLDYDAPPYPDGGLYTETPSGGRHYFYRYEEGDRHGLNVRPALDIPWMVKLYKLPELNPGRIPIQPSWPLVEDGLEEQSIQATTASEGERPPFRLLEECEFIRWFRDKREDKDWDGRYPLARAYAANVRMTTNADYSLGEGYRHTEQIYQHLGKPIRCATIVNSGFPCPQFDEWSGSCKKALGCTSPYGLARIRARTPNKQ